MGTCLFILSVFNIHYIELKNKGSVYEWVEEIMKVEEETKAAIIETKAVIIEADAAKTFVIE